MSESNPNNTTAVPSMIAGSWLGGWVFIPAPFESTDDHECAYLERDGERIPLLHCSVDLKEFTEIMSCIETTFSYHYASREADA